ncbi:unnamed protein product [marine sediment metagenome]|uniref:Uncharacterized protein n=1 Tax=marine sediment metagenome TaxID=412755 RepID=X1M0U0_9ZZZZ
MKKPDFKLTLDIKATYQIKVPGEVRKLQLGVGKIDIKHKEIDMDGLVITILTCVFDQAGLYGFLRRLYAMGLPLISVNCLECASVNGSDIV